MAARTDAWWRTSSMRSRGTCRSTSGSTGSKECTQGTISPSAHHACVHSLDPVDPDVDLHVPLDRMELVRHHASVLAAIASGGAVGAMARQLVGETWSTSGSFPWSTFLINVSGSLLIGILIAVLGKLPAQHR